MDIFDVYAAVIAGNITTLFAASLFFKGRDEKRTRAAHAIAVFATFMLAGVPCLYVLYRVS